MSSYESLHGWKTVTYKIQHGKEDSAYSAVFLVMMNKKKFASLPPDIQALIDRMSEEYTRNTGRCGRTKTRLPPTGSRRGASRLIALSKEEEARWYEKGAKPLVDEYIKEMNAARLPGDQAVRFIQEALKRYKK